MLKKTGIPKITGTQQPKKGEKIVPETQNLKTLTQSAIATLIMLSYFDYLGDKSSDSDIQSFEDLPAVANLVRLFFAPSKSVVNSSQPVINKAQDIKQGSNDIFEAHVQHSHPSISNHGKNSITECQFVKTAVQIATQDYTKYDQLKGIEYQTVAIKNMVDYFYLFGRTLNDT